MLRILVVAIATLLIVLPTAAPAQTTAADATSDSSCGVATDQGASATTTAAWTGGDTSSGDSPAGGSPSGGTAPEDVGSDASVSTSGGTSASASDSGAGASASASSGDSGSGVPLANAAQEPEPEGPGQQQPTEPGGQPQEPTGEAPTVPGGEAPAAETGGGLPRTGLEALKLALLGLVLFLVGARLRVVVKRRRASSWDVYEGTTDEQQSGRSAELAPDGLPKLARALTAFRLRPGRDEREPVGDGFEEDAAEGYGYAGDEYGAGEYAGGEYTAGEYTAGEYTAGEFALGDEPTAYADEGPAGHEYGEHDDDGRFEAVERHEDTGVYGENVDHGYDRKRAEPREGADLRTREEPRAFDRDEWPFPDPNAPSPTGLLPSTATAKRRARLQHDDSG